MKSALSQTLVRLTLAAYLAASGLGTGLHALFDCEHHDEHHHGLTAAFVCIATDSAGVLDAASDHIHDAENGCPVCQFHRLVQLHVVANCQFRGVAVIEMPLFVREQPAASGKRSPYSPRGPPEPAVSLAVRFDATLAGLSYEFQRQSLTTTGSATALLLCADPRLAVRVSWPVEPEHRSDARFCVRSSERVFFRELRCSALGRWRLVSRSHRIPIGRL